MSRTQAVMFVLSKITLAVSTATWPGKWHKVAAFDLPFRSISVSETIKTDGMKDQLYFRLVEQSILNMQVTSFGLRFSQLSVLNIVNYNCILADNCGFRCLRKIYKDLYTVETVESSRRYCEKRRFRLQFFFKSVSRRRHRMPRPRMYVLKMGLNFIHAVNKYLSQVLSILFTAISVITFILWNSSLFGLNVSWWQLFLRVQIYWLVFSLNCGYKKNDTILQLERIAYKGQPTKEEYLTVQIELPEVCLFSYKRT